MALMATTKEQQDVSPHASTDTPPFDLASFQLEQAVLEIRYPLALALWDKAGTLWQVIQEKWPEIKPVHAEPTRTAFQIGRNGLNVETQLARITTVNPDRSLEEFSAMAKDFLRLTTQYLQVLLYKRIGMRLLYFKEFKDKNQAASAFFSLGLVKIPDGKRFEIENQPIDPQYVLRWESEKKGTLVQCRVETRKTDFDPPTALESLIKPIHSEKSGIVFDVDYYTVSPVEPGQMDVVEWVRHGSHVIARDSKYIFGE